MSVMSYDYMRILRFPCRTILDILQDIYVYIIFFSDPKYANKIIITQILSLSIFYTTLKYSTFIRRDIEFLLLY